MSIGIARRIGKALGIKSETSIRALNEGLLEYVRLTQQSPATPTSGPISPNPKIFVVTTITTTSATMVAQDAFLVDDDTAGGDVTITLPPANTADNYPREIKKLGSTGNVIIEGAGVELIDGELQQILASRYNAITVISDGSAWWIL